MGQKVKVLVIQSQTVTPLLTHAAPSDLTLFCFVCSWLRRCPLSHLSQTLHLFSLSLSVHSLCRLKSWPLKPGTFLICVFCKQPLIMNVCINGTEKIQVLRKIGVQHLTKNGIYLLGFQNVFDIGFSPTCMFDL